MPVHELEDDEMYVATRQFQVSTAMESEGEGDAVEGEVAASATLDAFLDDLVAEDDEYDTDLSDTPTNQPLLGSVNDAPRRDEPLPKPPAVPKPPVDPALAARITAALELSRRALSTPAMLEAASRAETVPHSEGGAGSSAADGRRCVMGCFIVVLVLGAAPPLLWGRAALAAEMLCVGGGVAAVAAGRRLGGSHRSTVSDAPIEPTCAAASAWGGVCYILALVLRPFSTTQALAQTAACVTGFAIGRSVSEYLRSRQMKRGTN